MWLIAKPKEAGRPGEEKIRDKTRQIETQFLFFFGYIRPTLNACLDIVAQQCVVVRNDALGTFHAVMHAPKVQLKLDKHCQRRIFYEQYFRLACQDFHGLKIFNCQVDFLFLAGQHSPVQGVFLTIHQSCCTNFSCACFSKFSRCPPSSAGRAQGP